MAYINTVKRRSFDSVWRKRAPNYAQDDRIWFFGKLRKAKATTKNTAGTETEAGLSLRLKNGYGQDDSGVYVADFRLGTFAVFI